MHDLCTISIDSSGELLHRRGYKLGTAKAPVRETLAAAMILQSGWDKKSPLIGMQDFKGSKCDFTFKILFVGQERVSWPLISWVAGGLVANSLKRRIGYALIG